MILKVYTDNIVYMSEHSDDKLDNNRLVISNCIFKQTFYGSVVITRPTINTKVELYPQSIKHIIHTNS